MDGAHLSLYCSVQGLRIYGVKIARRCPAAELAPGRGPGRDSAQRPAQRDPGATGWENAHLFQFHVDRETNCRTWIGRRRRMRCAYCRRRPRAARRPGLARHKTEHGRQLGHLGRRDKYLICREPRAVLRRVGSLPFSRPSTRQKLTPVQSQNSPNVLAS